MNQRGHIIRKGQTPKQRRAGKRSPGLEEAGFTLVELLVTIAIMMTLSAIAMSAYSGFIQKTKILTAVNDLRTIGQEIDLYREDNEGVLPLTLDDIGRGSLLDPWGNPYQYVNFSTEPPGKWRRDRNLNPINTYFDLWSNGPDGRTQTQVMTPKGRDDIIRARDGNYVGIAGDF